MFTLRNCAALNFKIRSLRLPYVHNIKAVKLYFRTVDVDLHLDHLPSRTRALIKLAQLPQKNHSPNTLPFEVPAPYQLSPFAASSLCTMSLFVPVSLTGTQTLAFVVPCFARSFWSSSVFDNSRIESSRFIRVSRRPRRRPPMGPVCSTASGGYAEPGSDWRKAAEAWGRVNDAASSSTSSPSPGSGPTWRTVGSCDVLIPTASPPRAVVLFLGGFGAGFAPRTFYSNILRQLCNRADAAIIAYRLPALPLPNHSVEAVRAASAFCSTLATLRDEPSNRVLGSLPTVGVGHSLGSKLLLLICVDQAMREKLRIDGNVFMSFSNARIRDAIPNASNFQSTTVSSAEVADGVRKVRQFLNSWAPPNETVQNVKTSIDGVLDSVSGLASAFAPDATGDFVPTVEETLALAGGKYNISDNVVLKFRNDTIDNGADLYRVLRSRFGESGATMWREIKGTHVTPISPDFSSGSFASVGRDDWDQWVQLASRGIKEEVDGAVAILAAFVRLEIEMAAKKGRS